MIYIIHCNSCVYYKLSALQAFGQIAYLENGKWYLNKWVYNNQGVTKHYTICFLTIVLQEMRISDASTSPQPWPHLLEITQHQLMLSSE